MEKNDEKLEIPEYDEEGEYPIDQYGSNYPKKVKKPLYLCPHCSSPISTDDSYPSSFKKSEVEKKKGKIKKSKLKLFLPTWESLTAIIICLLVLVVCLVMICFDLGTDDYKYWYYNLVMIIVGVFIPSPLYRKKNK